MFVRKVVTDFWQGIQNIENIVEADWQKILSAINALDGEQRTLVILESENEVSHMAIGGGQNNKYVVYMTPDNNVFYNLVEPSKSESTVELNVGGQYGEYSERMCVDVNRAILAAKTFFEDGELDDSLDWEK